MLTKDFDYTLPLDLIAAYPIATRDESRLLVLGRHPGAIEHRAFRDLFDYLRGGDCLVINDSRVLPARLHGRRSGGGQAEVFLLEPQLGSEMRVWRALVRPGRKLAAGSEVAVGPAGAGGVIHIEKADPDGERIVRIECGGSVDNFLQQYGEIPLPPYIVAARKQTNSENPEAEDRERYQTVYAEPAGSVAAPTAGLHFTPELMERLAAKGVDIRRVTLHVGAGTFAPVKADNPRDHAMHCERFSIKEADARAIDAAVRDPERRVIAVGTTATRVLETLADPEGVTAGRIQAIDPSENFMTNLLILPGHTFRAIDGLITNFHLPKSTLLMLVSAFAGRERVMEAYREAIREKYRFYSYGDAMLIL